MSSGDGLVPPVNAPPGQQTPIGTQPGVQGQVFIGRYVIVFGTNGGVFIYAPTPGTGRLVGSWTATAGADPYGNTVPAGGLLVYGSGGSYINLSSTGGFDGNLALLFNPPLAAHVSTLIQLTGRVFNAGTPAEQEQLILSSGKAGTGLDDMALQLFSESNDGTRLAEWFFEAGGATLLTGTRAQLNALTPILATAGTRTSPTLVTTDNWTTLSGPFSNGWVISGSGVNAIRYRLTTDNETEIEWDIINPVAVGGTSFVFALPVPYFNPAFTRNLVAQAAPGGAGGIFIDGSGNFSVTNYSVANKELWGYARIPIS